MDASAFAQALVAKALECGASLAGIANVEDLKVCPSYRVAPMMPFFKRATSAALVSETGLPEGEVAWPEGMRSALVIAYSHPESDPVRDYWLDGKNPLGNMVLIRVIDAVNDWLKQTAPEVSTALLPYHIEKGGIYLKDAAVMAGLGTIGKNNLLVTPEYGPRVRLRAMLLSVDLPSAGPMDYDPCEGCAMPCLAACPQDAFCGVLYRPEDYDGISQLPGRTGSYSKPLCNEQMSLDIQRAQYGEIPIEGYGIAKVVKPYCRACEFGCVVGRG